MNASPTATMLAINVYVDVVECWRCHKSSPVVIGFDNPATGCPQAVDERFVDALAEVKYRSFRTEVGLGVLKRRWSRTAGVSYWSQGCASCDALFGGFPLRELSLRHIEHSRVLRLHYHAHWKAGGEFGSPERLFAMTSSPAEIATLAVAVADCRRRGGKIEQTTAAGVNK